MPFPTPSSRQSFPELEKEILAFWQQEKIFQKSLQNREGSPEFVFYDGPPFATGTPHYGHLTGGFLKDAVPRWQTMLGKKVNRQFGWDCHGLPIEQIVEKIHKISGKSDIEQKIGVGKFNEDCRSNVMAYVSEWRKVTERIGRWVDMDNDYKTMDAPFMESVWSVFKALYDRGYVYEDYRVNPFSIGMGTPLSNFEVNQNYKDKQDKAVTVKFDLRGNPGRSEFEYTKNGHLRYVLAVIRDNAGRILMLKNAKHEGRWQCPGGKIDLNETAEEALIREIREELKTEIVIRKSIGKRNVLTHGVLFEGEYFEVELLNTPTIQEPEKHLKMEWVSLENAENSSGFILKTETETIHEPAVISHTWDAIALHDFANNTIQSDKLSILAWTTTPWTLPANLALAVGEKIIYCEIRDRETGEWMILAKDRLSSLPKKPEAYQVLRDIPGSELVGIGYEPLNPEWFAQEEMENMKEMLDPSLGNYFNGISTSKERVWTLANLANRIFFTDQSFKIVSGHHVTTESGTGVVHIAPAFGEDDFIIGKKEDIGFISHISNIGLTENLKTEYNGRYVFDFNEDIIKELKSLGKLVKLETIVHSYPHCWRTDIPLIYKAIPAWYVRVEKEREKLIKNNAKINWIPGHLKEGRFGKWIEQARDWNISRNRYWGSAIPAWKSEDGKITKIIGSIEELYQANKAEKQITKIILIRHARTTYNEHGRADCWPADKARLTELGHKQAQVLITTLAGESIDHIYCSPMTRCQETIAPLAADRWLIPELVHDLREIDIPGIQDEIVSWIDILHWTPSPIDGKNGESVPESAERIKNILQDIVQKNGGKTVVICTHGDPTVYAQKALSDFDYETRWETTRLKNGEAKILYAYADKNLWTPMGCGVDLHKHLVDKVILRDDTTGTQLRRVPEVLDCWFESGSMPYASRNTLVPASGKIPENLVFPGDFIAEGIDQTRGWFYVLLVLSTLLFDEAPFKNVVVNGLTLAEDGQKMSKSKKNYTDPMEIVEKHGADALRFYLLNSQIVRAEDLRVSDKNIEETVKKIMLPLWNAYTFFATYANVDGWEKQEDVLFVRHGEIDANIHGYPAGGEINFPLNEKGKQQAEELGIQLAGAGKKFDVTIVSNLVRTQETAAILGKHIALGEVVEASELRELDYGAHEGSYEEMAQKLGFTSRAEMQVHLYKTAQEPLDTFVQRVSTAYTKIIEKYKGKRILFVGHSGVFRALSEHLLGQKRSETFLGGHHGLPNCGTFTLPRAPLTHELDIWMITEREKMIRNVSDSLNRYNIQEATGQFESFLESLTNWYIRRSRRRFWTDGISADKDQAYWTLHGTLETFCRILAPFAPYIAEKTWKNLTQEKSVHFSWWPTVIPFFSANPVSQKVAQIREIISLGLAWRGSQKIRVRQPLASMSIPHEISVQDKQIIMEEMNVKEVKKIEDIASIATISYSPDARKIGQDERKFQMKEILAKAKSGNASVDAEKNLIIIAENGAHIRLAPDEYQTIFQKKEGIDLDLYSGSGTLIAIDAHLTDNLIQEGYARDLVREIQELRKKTGYQVDDRVLLEITGEKNTPVELFREYIESETLSKITHIPTPDNSITADLGNGYIFEISIQK